MPDLSTRAVAAWNDLIDADIRAGRDVSALEVPAGFETRNYVEWLNTHRGYTVSTVYITADSSGTVDLRNFRKEQEVDGLTVLSPGYEDVGLVLASDDHKILTCAPFGDGIQVWMHTAA